MAASTRVYRRKATKRKSRKIRPRSRAVKPWVNRNMVNLGQGFPKQVTVTHKYTDIITLVSTGGAIAQYLWSCNGLYDPDVTSTGHQPLLFDQFSALYDHYTVLGSRITLKCMPASSASTVPMTVLLMLNDDTSLISTNPIVNAEQVGSTIKFLQMDAGNSLTLTKNFSLNKTYGKDSKLQGKLIGTATANPAEQTYFQLLTQTTDVFTTQSIIIYFQIEYITLWNELKDIAQS